MSKTAGSIANQNGKKLEDIIESSILSYLNVCSENYSKTDERENILLKNAPYDSIYGGKCRSEFLLCYEGRRIRIECKTQNAHGSVDEKLPYLFNNMTLKNDEESIVILEGNGFRPGARDWLIHESKGTKLSVFNLESFQRHLLAGVPVKTKSQILKEKLKRCFSKRNVTNLN